MRQSKTIQSIFFFLASIFLILLPIYKRLLPIVVILFILTWLIERKFRTKFSALFHDNWSFSAEFTLMSVFYLMHIIAMIYTNNTHDGMSEIERKLSLIAIPLIFYPISSFHFTKKQRNTLFYTFVAACIGSSAYCFICALNNYIVNHNVQMMYYSDFSIIAHPTYYAMYMITALILTISFLRSEWKNINITIKTILLVCILWFTLIIALCNSRGAILSLLAVVCFLVAYLIIKQKKILFGFSIIAVIGLAILGSIKFAPNIYNRFYQIKDILEAKSITDIKEWNGTTVRLQIMHSSKEIIKDNFWNGVAPGDVTDELVSNYKKNNFDIAAERKYNAHNQYLQTFIGLGFIGFIIFIAIFAIPFIYAIKNNDILLMSFMIMIFVLMLFESMLQRQDGIMFIIFFITILHNRERIFRANQQ